MVIGVSYFGNKAFLPLVNTWLDVYKRSGCKYRVVIITDLDAIVPPDSVPYDVNGTKALSHLRIDVSLYPEIIRKKKAFDMQGALSTQAIQILPRCLIVDADAFFVKDPTPLIESLPRAVFGMTEDPVTRGIKGCTGTITEYNAGVLYYGTDSREDRLELARLYRDTFNELRPANDNIMLEQITWSVVLHKLKARGFQLPRALNWSRMWGKNNADYSVFHEHGPDKWNFIQGLELNSIDKPKSLYRDYYN